MIFLWRVGGHQFQSCSKHISFLLTPAPIHFRVENEGGREEIFMYFGRVGGHTFSRWVGGQNFSVRIGGFILCGWPARGSADPFFCSKCGTN